MLYSPETVAVLVPLSDSPKPQVGVPVHYHGDPETCSAFLINSSLLLAAMYHRH